MSVKARFVVHVSGPAGDGPETRAWGPLEVELERRGCALTVVRGTSPIESDTANAARAAEIVAALRDVRDPVAIIGVSNQGNFLARVAAARPVRRLVYVNACIPEPQKAFIEVCLEQDVAVPGSYLDGLIKDAQPLTDEFRALRTDPTATGARWRTFRERLDASQTGRIMRNFYEVLPLTILPKVDNVCISGSADDQVSPAYEQAAARRVLGIEPAIIEGGGHGNVVQPPFVGQMADICVAGL